MRTNCFLKSLPLLQFHMNKLQQAQAILKALELPKGQQNDRSGFILLALAGIAENTPWPDSQATSMAVVGRKTGSRYPGIMRFINEHYGPVYGISYEQNSRESFRKETLRQFDRAGIIEMNPEADETSKNSQHNHYRLTPAMLRLLRAYDGPQWANELATFKATYQSLQELYQGARQAVQLDVTLPDGFSFTLSPGKHNELERAIIESFRPEFAPGSVVLYVGDTAQKDKYQHVELLAELQLVCDTHDKIPDVVLYDAQRQWLFLIEAVTTHGPISPERMLQLAEWSRNCPAGKVYVTAFLDKATYRKYAADIAWETEVWLADAPQHLIHFNGDRFIGPR